MNETYVTVVGRVTGDLRQRRSKNGHKIVSFGMASNERRYEKETDQWVDGKSLFLNVTCWRGLANGVADSLSKGDPIVATGRLSLREFEFEGHRRSSLELDAHALGPNLALCTAEVRRWRSADGTGDPGREQAAVPAQGGQSTETIGVAEEVSTDLAA